MIFGRKKNEKKNICFFKIEKKIYISHINKMMYDTLKARYCFIKIYDMW